MKKESGGKGPHTTIEIIRMKETDEHVKQFIDDWKDAGVDRVSVTPCMTWLDAIDDMRVEPPANFGYKPCLAPFNNGCILSDGTVVPCCMDVRGKMPLGNVKEQPFQEIWNGEKAQALRQRMLTGNIEKGSICDGCYWTFSRSKQERMLMKLIRPIALSKAKKAMSSR